MKVILCGKNDAAVACLQFLVAQDDEVLAVGASSDDGVDGWQRSLKREAERLGVTFLQPKRINDAECIERLVRWAGDVLVSIQYEQILKAPLLRSVGCPSLNLHFALLPRHRGVAPIAWAILSGDTRAGVTLHEMTPAIDAGDILAQRSVPIAADETARELYDQLTVEAVELFRQCYPFSPAELSQRTPQKLEASCYHRQGDLDFSDTRIDWSRPAAELHHWIRAMIFPPFQFPHVILDGRTLAVTRIGPSVLPANSAQPGVVAGASPAAIDIAADGGVIRLCGILDQQTGEDALELLSRAVRVGQRSE